ncbi:plastocyanin [Spirulina sp. 06S082]|uniref:plastocyanin n=1 Tax=Spirulina sp. 06S082 TaxID=3110248 RepID=UPI002B1FC4CF|nr:plastocyanin [Spirulina sp. 06S082]MEA5471291.1 plastocyanin [Spirulina sp. 06S082]
MIKKLGLFLSIILFACITFAITAIPAAAATYTVKMGADNGVLKFVPETLHIKPGDTVNFVMNKLAPHNIIFNKGPDGANLDDLSSTKLLFSPGQTYSTTFPQDTPLGVYQYYCQPHRGAGMLASIIVE